MSDAIAQVDGAIDRLLAGDTTDEHSFLGRQFDLGLAWVHHPVGDGGLGLDASLQRHIRRRLAAAGAPSMAARNPVGLGQAAATIVAHGTSDQRRRLLRPLFTGEEIWCQLFSEPAAGSDLASLASRADRDGDDWIVSGQKVWTSLAHVARRGLLLARTERTSDRHGGITCFALDMAAPGVDVRPLRQLTGDAEFNEVFLTEVRVPDTDRIGAPGEGWRVAVTTLMNERYVGSGGGGRTGPMQTAFDLYRARPCERHRDAMMRLWVESEIGRLTQQRAAAVLRRGSAGPEGSIMKLALTESYMRIYDLCTLLMGPDAMLYDDYTMRRPDAAFDAESALTRRFLRSRAHSIEGGTSEVMRNIRAERILGLPREPNHARMSP